MGFMASISNKIYANSSKMDWRRKIQVYGYKVLILCEAVYCTLKADHNNFKIYIENP